MTEPGRPDPEEHTPDPDPVTAAQEYTPEDTIDDPSREADPADVAEQIAEVPTADEDGPIEDDAAEGT